MGGRAVRRDELENMISICESIEASGIDPFTVDVKALLSRLREVLEKAKDVDDFVLDAETLYRVAVLISLQSKWLRQKASALFIDHQLLAIKLAVADTKELAVAFLRAWRPIVRLEQITPYRMKAGMEHFLNLPPIDRERSGLPSATGVDIMGLEEMSKRGWIEKQRFEESLERIREELLASGEGEIDYTDFVLRDSLAETVERAYLVSFLVTSGEADLVVNPLTDEKKLVLKEGLEERKQVNSLALAFNEETWEQMLHERKRK